MITETRVREIIREELDKELYKQAIPIIKSVMTLAKTYVDSVVNGKRDSTAATGLSEAMSDLNSLVKMMQKRRAPEASNLAVLARLGSELIKKSGFWQTPTFIGRGKHQDDLVAHLAKMKKVAGTLASSISAATPTSGFRTT